ncbi:exodeoxyribonuclease VII large subunit [Sphingomonas sp. SUN039]|uniref:exodeoxyribonuclease VII large subunit n=1 Tax=Sphingomonas sp. SUN039 TaxID=2937787 RepID=UPI002164517A|nr:exodeoxyribonuclease VII large subunit [Sphingomonas sp. SUN039]UVO54931.1 exodeoxyribonuclease VII large subunit [Sphingomonas sp. SUN039]
MPDPQELENSALLADSGPGDNSAPFSVTELSGRLKRHVEDGFGHVRVRGEISGWKRVASGHCYMALKDDGAALDGVMWKMSAARLAFAPADGVEVVATGKLTTYPGRSKYQIIIDRMELAGEGAMLALLEKLKAKLAGEGLFDANRKRPLPYLPRVIGVVTSPTGAVIRDILHRLADRFPVQVVVWPVLVQGNGAAEQVARAVRGFSDMAGGPAPRPDLVIVARGGGSVEDLWSFNDEAVVRAVAACTIPVISAVGHETDTTLCDFAADVRAPTPTAAAEMAVPVRRELLANVEALATRSLRIVHRYRERGGERLAAVAVRMPDAETLLASQRQRTDDLGERLRRGLAKSLADARGDLAHASGALRPPLLAARLAKSGAQLRAVRLDPRLVARPLADARDRIDRLWRIADSLNPDAVLKRGYARVENRTGASVTTTGVARREGALALVFADGRIDVHVDGGGPRPAARAARTAPEQASFL